MPTSGPHIRATTVRSSRSSGRLSSAAEATVARPADRVRPVQGGRHGRRTGQGQQRDRHRAAVSQARSEPRGVFGAEGHPISHGPTSHAPARRRCQRGNHQRGPMSDLSRCAVVDEVGDQVALHRGQRHQQRARVRVTARITTPPAAEFTRGGLQQHREAHHQNRAGARRGDRVRRTAQERRRPTRRAHPCATRAAGDTSNSNSHPPRGDRSPQKAHQTQPSRNVATATTTRITASVTINPPY